jgi:site-specific recombinase XerD
MTLTVSFASVLTRFFTQRLIQQRNVSPHTLGSYRDTFRLLLRFTKTRTGKDPSQLVWDDIDAPLISAFLDDLQEHRAITARSRNLRLTAIRSLFRYAAFELPGHAEQIQRVHLGTGAYVHVIGKGRKERCTPLTKQTAAVLQAWLQEPARGEARVVFPNRCGARLSSDGLQYLLARHVETASGACVSLRHKRISPHVLRHSAAMMLLQAGVDTTVIALWLGHESVETTRVYLEADLELKRQMLARTMPPGKAPTIYRPDDALLVFLQNL